MADQQYTAGGSSVAKPVTIGVVGVSVRASARVLNHFILPGEGGDSVPTVVTPAPQSASAPSANVPPAGEPSASGPPAGVRPSGGAATESGEQSPKAEAAGEAPGKAEAPGSEVPQRAAPAEPSFDGDRVDPGGNPVLAGHGAPNAEIAIMDGDAEIGRVTPDARGAWVFIPPSKRRPEKRRVGKRC